MQSYLLYQPSDHDGVSESTGWSKVCDIPWCAFSRSRSELLEYFKVKSGVDRGGYEFFNPTVVSPYRDME